MVISMRRWMVGLSIVLLFSGCGQSADAQLATPTPPKHATVAASADEAVQMKATLIKLQVQVLERDREIGTLRAQVAELKLNALGVAVQTLDPAVKKALGLEPQPVAKPVSKE
jgi:hypothetical protein